MKTLKTELLKFGGFRFPDDMRASINYLLGTYNVQREPLPISDKNNPIVKSIFIVFSVPQTLRLVGGLIKNICDIISQKTFVDDALASILFSLNQSANEAEDIALTLLQFYSTILPTYYKDIQILQVIFSNTLSLLIHTKRIVSETAFATFQQMISVLFDSIRSNPPLNSKELSKISNFINKQFDPPILAIPWSCLSDICSILTGRSPSLLQVPTISLSTIARLWHLILTSHSSFLISTQPLLDVVESSISLPIHSVSPLVDAPILDSLVTFAAVFCKYLPSTTTAIMSNCLAGISTPNQGNVVIYSGFDTLCLAFFRCIFSFSTFPSEFFAYCDPTGSLLIAIVEALDSICLLNTPLKLHLDYTDLSSFHSSQTKKGNSDNINSNYENLLISKGSLPYEACLLLKDQKIIWNQLIKVIIKAIRIADLESIPCLFKIIEDLLIKDDFPYDLRLSLLRILCSLVTKQQIAIDSLNELEILANECLHKKKSGFFFKQKRQKSCYLLLNILDKNPLVYNHFFLRLFMTFSADDLKLKINPSFTSKYSNDLLSQICSSLSRGNDYCISFLGDVVKVNISRFELIWKSIKKRLAVQVSNIVLEQKNPNTLLKFFLFQIPLTKYDHQDVFSSISKIFPLSTLPEIEIIFRLKQLLSANSSFITKAWSDILNIIRHVLSNSNLYKSFDENTQVSLKNNSESSFSDDSINNIQIRSRTNENNQLKDLVITTFDILRIAIDSFDHLSEDSQSSVVDLIFNFGKQTIVLNISLSAFAQFWNIVPSIKNEQTWISILDSLSSMFNDLRTDVAITIISTFFNLLSSNSGRLSQFILQHSLFDCCLPYLKNFKIGIQSVSKNALLEICHFGCGFYDRLFYQQKRSISLSDLQSADLYEDKQSSPYSSPKTHIKSINSNSPSTFLNESHNPSYSINSTSSTPIKDSPRRLSFNEKGSILIPSFDSFWDQLIYCVENFLNEADDEESMADLLPIYNELISCNKFSTEKLMEFTYSYFRVVNQLAETREKDSYIISSLHVTLRFNFEKCVSWMDINLLKGMIYTTMNICKLLNNKITLSISVQKAIDILGNIANPLKEDLFDNNFYFKSCTSEKKEEFHKISIKGLIDCAIADFSTSPMRIAIMETLSKISPSDYLFEVAKPTFIYPESLHFLRCQITFLAKVPANFVTSVSNSVSENYTKSNEKIDIIRENKDLAVNAFGKLLEIEKANNAIWPDSGPVSRKFFRGANPDQWKDYVSIHKDDFKTLSWIWATYCNPQEGTFESEISSIVGTSVVYKIENILNKIEELRGLSEIISILDFFEKVKAPPQKIGEKQNCTSWHLMDLTPHLLKLMNCGDGELKLRAKKILQNVIKELPQVIDN